MRKTIFIFALIFLLFGLCGCNLIKNETTSGKTIIPEYTEIINCDVLNNIKMVVDNYSGKVILANDGYLYSFGKFSDGTNCKKIALDTTIKIVINNYDLYGENNNYYLLENTDNKYSIIKSDYLYEEKLLKNVKDAIRIKRNIDNNDDVYYYVLKNDGILYKILEKNGIFTEEVYKSFSDEKIIDFNTNYEIVDSIKTDKAYYVNRVKDDRCYEYDDIKCEYDLIKDDYFSSKYNDIAFIYNCNGGHYGCNYILKDGKKYEDHIGG